jgi:hypothetical protein
MSEPEPERPEREVVPDADSPDEVEHDAPHDDPDDGDG